MAVTGATLVALLVITGALTPTASAYGTHPALPAPGVGGSPWTGTATRPGVPPEGPGPTGGPRTPVAPATGPDVPPSVTVITAACTVTGASAPIASGPANFTLTADFTGAILDECNGSALNGDGYSLVMSANASFAIELYNVVSVEVSGFLIVGASTGVLALGVQSSAVIANTINATGYGIEVEYSSQVSVEDNSLDGDYGSLYEVDDGLTVSYNQLALDQYAVYAEDVNGATFQSDQCNGSSSALDLYDSSSVTVWGDNLSHTTNGLYAQNVYHLAVDWNNASNSEYPIEVYYGGATTGEENAGVGSTVGLTVYFTEDATFTTESFVGASEYGAEVEDATNVSITGSDFDLAGFEGIFVADATHLTLTGDTADGFVDGGVVVSQSTDVTITGTGATNGSGSLAPAFSTYFDEGLVLESDNGSASAYGVEDQGSLNVTIEGCQFWRMTEGDAGISLQSDAGFTVDGTDIIGASGDALDAFDSAGLVVRGNTFTVAAQEAIYVASSDGVTIIGNDASHAGFTAMDLEQLDGFTIANNDVGQGTGSSAEGIYLQSDASGTVDGNNASDQRTGLALIDATNVSVIGNQLSGASVGFVASGDVSCTIAGNEVANDVASFNVGSSEHLAVFHNNFVDDLGWVLPPSTLVANWSAGYPGGGNYWSNFTTPDAEHGPSQNLSGPDGIVDDPFVLNATNQDGYPLTQPWTARTITFTESGLPAGTAWSVVVNATAVTGNGMTLVYAQPNAVATIYTYLIGTVPGFRASESSGSVAPGNGDAQVAVSFAPFQYTISFQASGLSAAANWSIAVGPISGGATGDLPVTFSLANGSYSFQVAPVAGYAVEPSTGPLVVDGNDQSITIAFDLVAFAVTFEEIGLPAGASWSVDLAGSERSTAGGSLTFSEPNGSYSFNVASPGGYVVHPASGAATVNGTTTIYLAFASGTSSPFQSPLGDALVAAIVGLAILAIVAIALWRRDRRPPPPSGPGTAVPATPAAGPPEGAPRWRQ